MASIIQRVSLEDIRFNAYHGYYEQEHKVGNEYLVTINTEMDVFGDVEDDLSNTVNYERLYHIVETEMAVPRKLLESVAHSILNRIRHEFLSVKSIRVQIAKVDPPLGSLGCRSVIELCFKR